MKGDKKFPECSKSCEVVKTLGVSECDSVCPEKRKVREQAEDIYIDGYVSPLEYKKKAVDLIALGLSFLKLKVYLEERYQGIKSGLVLEKMRELEKEAK